MSGAVSDLVVVAAANPVGWARSQMAFTLAFHIILVPLGVSWSFMTLVANYRGVRHGDSDALLLAQRWSKYMALTFAVGAVTGTVLSFEFGLLWPRFMGRWGEAFGVPFAFEGIFFFTEGVFVAIYIFGWRRLRPWLHFWTGVPIAVAGVFGAISVVAANAWMNAPSGFTLDSAGNVVSVDPWGVIFNKAMPLQAAHMVVAAYLVGGFLVSSVYAAAMLRGRTDRYHRLGFLIPFTVAAIATPVQMGVGDALARWVYQEQPVKFAAIELVPQTTSDVPRDPCSATSTPTAPSPAASRSPDWPRGSRTRAPARRRSSRASTACRRTRGRPSPRSMSCTCAGTSWSGSARCSSSSPSGMPPAGSSGGGCPAPDGSCVPPRAPAFSRSSPSRRGGWSPRSAVSRGSSTT